MVLIIGAGAVGTTLAGYLAAAQQPVRLLVRDSERYTTVAELVVEGGAGQTPVVVPRPEITNTLDLSGVDYVFICVKYAALDQILAQLPLPLPAGVTLVSTLNGVSAVPRMRERYPAGPLANMTIMFNAQLLAPVHTRTSRNPQVIIDNADATLANLFRDSGMGAQVTQGPAVAWGKLLLNLANAICAVTHSSIKDLLSQRDLQRILAGSIDEAISLLDQAGIDYRFPIPMPYPMYRFLLRHGGPIPWWMAKLKNGMDENARPSMVADVEAGRETEIDQINGELEAIARARNLPTPINDVMVSLVRSFSGQIPPPYLSPAQLRARLGL